MFFKSVIAIGIQEDVAMETYIVPGFDFQLLLTQTPRGSGDGSSD